MTSYLSFHFGPALLLLFALPHVLVLLLGLREGLQELVEDAKELVRLYLAGFFTKVLDCPQELWERGERGHAGEGHTGLDLCGAQCDRVLLILRLFYRRLISSQLFESGAGDQ